MQDPNADTEWNDVLRAKGIIPEKEKEAEITEEAIISMLEKTIDNKALGIKDMEDMSLDDLDELEDSEDEAVLAQFRNRRIAEMKELAGRAKYGSVREISGQDYISEVNKAGEGVWVILHLYKQGIPFCALLNQHFANLAPKFPTVKFLRSIASTCIPNFPESNLPSIFVYFEGNIKKQFIGTVELRGPNLTLDELEFLLGRLGAVTTNITEDPRPQVKDKMMADLADHNDWSL